jgi:peptidoglycan/xylan/chitin deacetylase (PgdA/CDA1 family)
MRWPRIVVMVAALAVVVPAGCASPNAIGLARSAGGSSSIAPGVRPSSPGSGSPSPGAGPSGQGAAVDPRLAPFLARLPRFAPPPVPVPVAIPAGPSAPIFHRLPVSQPVAFLTMDDGWTQLPEALPLMQAAHIPFTMFLLSPVAAKSPAFFKNLESAGGVIEDHTITHPELRGRSYDSQRHEICDSAASLARTFGTKPNLFRPPFGDYDRTTLRAVHDCGLRVALHWSETVNAGKVNYQTTEHRIRPGDIILMHFRPAFVQDVIAALTAIHDAGLTPALLEDYLV